MVIDQDASIIVGWKRKKLILNTEQYSLISKGRKNISEIDIDHTFEKDAKLYMDKKGRI